MAEVAYLSCCVASQYFDNVVNMKPVVQSNNGFERQPELFFSVHFFFGEAMVVAHFGLLALRVVEFLAKIMQQGFAAAARVRNRHRY